MLKILFIGDISARVGRNTIRELLPKVKQKYKPDLVIANIENCSGGIGITREGLEELVGYGIQLCTGGDHTFGISDFWMELNDNLPFVRPANYEAVDMPGQGYEILDLGDKGSIAIISLLGQELFTHTQRVKSPFWHIDELLKVPEIAKASLRLIDFHAEAASEKLSFAWYVKDRVEVVLGTHTHVATADNRLLGNKVAYVTDVGQTGPYEASLWVDFDSAIHNFKYPYRKSFKVAEDGPRIFNSVLVKIDDSRKNFSPISIERVDIVVEEE